MDVADPSDSYEGWMEHGEEAKVSCPLVSDPGDRVTFTEAAVYPPRGFDHLGEQSRFKYSLFTEAAITETRVEVTREIGYLGASGVILVLMGFFWPGLAATIALALGGVTVLLSVAIAVKKQYYTDGQTEVTLNIGGETETYQFTGEFGVEIARLLDDNDVPVNLTDRHGTPIDMETGELVENEDSNASGASSAEIDPRQS